MSIHWSTQAPSLPVVNLTSFSGPVANRSATTVRNLHVLSQVEENVHRCMAASHIEHSVDTSASQRNAKYLYEEYRKMIPEHSLPNHKSHCWKTSFSFNWYDQRHIQGHVGNITFNKYFRKRSTQVPYILDCLNKLFPSMQFESDMLCLPNIFLAGFPKCGSTYLYCILNKLISVVTKRLRSHHETVKEPHFWVSANDIKDVHVPNVQSLKTYFLNFIPGLQQSSRHNRSNAFLVDGSPNMFFKWPRFYPNEQDLVNYCLIPSVLPNLLPQSKYIVIMRNPVRMMYSAFWFSCTSIQGKLPTTVQLKGPHLFHERVEEKLEMFNGCLKDVTVPALNYTCPMDSKEAYSRCVLSREHLLDTCIHHIAFNNFSPELAGCGRTRLAMGAYYIHLKKWLQVVARDRFHFLTLEDLVRDSKSVMKDLLGFLGLSTSSVSSFDDVANRVRYSCDTNSQSAVNYSRDPRLQMREDTKELLDIFFHPFNHLLGTLINRTSLWTT